MLETVDPDVGLEGKLPWPEPRLPQVTFDSAHPRLYFRKTSMIGARYDQD